MTRLYKEQRDKIVQAINLAKNPGSCVYVEEEQGLLCPQCIIAQLYVLEGGDVKDMVSWEGNTLESLIGYFNYAEIENIFSNYPTGLLIELQEVWDTGAFSLEAARQETLALLEAWQ